MPRRTSPHLTLALAQPIALPRDSRSRIETLRVSAMLILAMIAGSGLIACTEARAEEPIEYTGNHMIVPCQTSIARKANSISEAWLAGVCEGTVGGIYEAGKNLTEGWRFCPPGGTPSTQSLRVVVRYMENHPEMLHIDFGTLVAVALRDAWPCPIDSPSGRTPEAK